MAFMLHGNVMASKCYLISIFSTIIREHKVASTFSETPRGDVLDEFSNGLKSSANNKNLRFGKRWATSVAFPEVFPITPSTPNVF